MTKIEAELRLGRSKVHMKVKASIKTRCMQCKIVRRKGVLRVVCTNPRHKQRQG